MLDKVGGRIEAGLRSTEAKGGGVFWQTSAARCCVCGVQLDGEEAE